MTRINHYSPRLPIVGRFFVVLFLILASVEAPWKRGTVFAQSGGNRCAELSALADRALQEYLAAMQRDDDATDRIANALQSAIRTSHEVEVVRDELAHYQTMEIFVTAGSAASSRLQKAVQNLEGKLKSAMDRQAAASRELPAAMAEFTRAEEEMDLKHRAHDDAYGRELSCDLSQMNSPQSPSPVPGGGTRPASPAGRISFQLADISPEQKAFYGGWTWSANGGQINLKDPSVGREEFTWTAVPQTFGAEGFQVVLHVQSTSNPNSRALAGIHIVPGDFTATPGQQIEALSENGQMAHKELAVSVRPPPNPSGNDLYIRIGADYGPGFIYHFRVIR
jgi:hypothetical protein